MLIVVESSVFVLLISAEVSLDKSEISVLSVWNVSDDKSDISVDVSLLNSLISRLNSLDVYSLRSVISDEVND